MSKKSPQLRFEGFTDDWEERKIKDIFKITRGQVLAATETSEEKSDISPFPVYSSQTKNNGLMGYYKDYLFDTAITWTTDGANAGTVSYRSGRFYSTNVNGVLISDKGYTNKAISEILNLEAWKWVSHVGNPKLMNNVMGDISIMIPSSFEEQDRLSDFLNQLDDTIALHQRKLDLLKEQKKGYLQKMFPKNGAKVPELRFAGFADDWEERKLAEFTTSFSGGTPSAGNSSYYKGDIPFIRSGEINSDKTELFLTEDGLKNSSAKMVSVGDILYALYGATSGEVGISQINGAINQAILAIRPIGGYSSHFIMQWLRLQKQKIIDKYLQGGQGNLSGSIVKNLILNVPNFEEQQRIGSFFKQLDDTIALHQRKLDLLKEQKKGFLQKMFV
ncbi:restriction endonuclease subunit S (plasmid) [Streptococcus iniae]|uniref:restriction endonuclease subunit S n=2 Tax=Streptococcus TaxID=1301 RepID=UPI00287B803C|nr:restriction endonuclease subunit S [Streptococcus iniae]